MAEEARAAFERVASSSPLKTGTAASGNAVATTTKHHQNRPTASSTDVDVDPADAPLPSYLERALPALPRDPGLDGFVEAIGDGEAGSLGAKERREANSMQHGNDDVDQGEATTTETSTIPPHLLSLLLRAAMVPWEGAECDDVGDPGTSKVLEGDDDGVLKAQVTTAASERGQREEENQKKLDLCASLPLRLRHARCLASRLCSSPDISDALSEAVEANGALVADLEAAAAASAAAAAKGNNNGETDESGAESLLLRSLASSLSKSQPRSSGWLRVRLVSYRAAAPKKKATRSGDGTKSSPSSPSFFSGLFACCAAPPRALLDDEEETAEGEGGRRTTSGGGEGFNSSPADGGGSSSPRPKPSLFPPPSPQFALPQLPLPRAARPPRKRPAAVALVWLRDEQEEQGGGRRSWNESPLPPPLLRTPAARRGATSVWEDVGAASRSRAASLPSWGGPDEGEDRFVPPTKVSTKFCTPVRGRCGTSSSPSSRPSPSLIFVLRDALGRGKLAAAVAGGDPEIGRGELPLSEVLMAGGASGGGGGGGRGKDRKARRAPGPVTIGVPIFREIALSPIEADASDATAKALATRRELAGVLRVVVDFVSEERTASSSGDDNSSTGDDDKAATATKTFPAASNEAWKSLLSLLWRAWEREEEEEELEGKGEEENDDNIDESRTYSSIPTQPPPLSLASPRDLSLGLGGLAQGFRPLERGVALGILPRGRFLAAARSSAALCRVSAAAQQAAVLSLLLERWDPRGERDLVWRRRRRLSSSSPLETSTAVAELAAALWKPLAAVARGEAAAASNTPGLSEDVAAVVAAAGGRAAASAVRAVEAFDLLWSDDGSSSPQSPSSSRLAAATSTLELLSLAVTWSPRVEALADPLTAHVRRAAQRMIRRAVFSAASAASASSASSILAPMSTSAAAAVGNKRRRAPSPTLVALSAATAACDAARKGIELDSSLAPAFDPSNVKEEEKEGLDLVSVAGRVRVSAALSLLRSALSGGVGEEGDEAGAPPAYGAAAQRAEDAARALSSALERARARRNQPLSSSSSRQQHLLPPPIDVDALFDPCVSSALWALRPLAIAWVDRTLRPKEASEEAEGGTNAAPSPSGGIGRGIFSAMMPRGSAAARSRTEASANASASAAALSSYSSVWKPLSRAAGALYSPAVVDLYSLVASAADGLGSRALASPPRSPAAALRNAKALAAALAPAPERMAALTEAALEAEYAASIAAEAAAFADSSTSFDGVGAATSSSSSSSWWRRIGLGGSSDASAAAAAEAGRRLPASARPPKPPHALSSAACVQLSSLFELRSRAEDADDRLRQMLMTSGKPRLPANVELASRLSATAARGASVVAGRLAERLRFEFARVADEARTSSLSSSSSPRRNIADVSGPASVVVAELESLDGRLSRAALAGVSWALWGASVSAAERVLLSAAPVAAAASSSSTPPYRLTKEEAEAVLAAASTVADALSSLSGPAPLPLETLESVLEKRLRSLASLAAAPTSEVSEAADSLWAAAAARGARACASSGLGRRKGGGGSRSSDSKKWSDDSDDYDDDDDDDDEGEKETTTAATATAAAEPSPPKPNPLLAAASKYSGLDYSDALRLLNSRASAAAAASAASPAGRSGGIDDGERAAAAEAARRAAARATDDAMTATFGLRRDPVVASFSCRASCCGGARGTLFLSERHLAFAKEGFGVGAGAVQGAAGFSSSVAAASTSSPMPAFLSNSSSSTSYPPLAVFKLSRLARMERCRRRRSRGIAIWDKEKVKEKAAEEDENENGLPAVDPSAAFWEFASPGRDEAEAVIRVHVMGSDSALDRFLRGLPPTTPTSSTGGAPVAVVPPRRLPFIPDRVFEVRLASSGPFPGWGGGAWATLRASSSSSGSPSSSKPCLSLESDECVPRRVVASLSSPSSSSGQGEVQARQLRTSRALAQGSGVAITARWKAGVEEEEEGAATTATTTLVVGGFGGSESDDDGDKRASKRPPRRQLVAPLCTLRLVGMTTEAAADLLLDLRSRAASAVAATASSS